MKKVVRFIIKFVNKATADSVPAYAAQVAFFVMLSFFPFMMLLVMIVSKLSVKKRIPHSETVPHCLAEILIGV